MRRKRRQSLPKQAVTLEIEKLSHEGRGIAHLDGKVIFVEEALPGESVKALYTQRKDAFDQARTVEVLKPSPHRIEAPCIHASICGGCSLQHFEPDAQLAFKSEVLHELLSHALDGLAYEKLKPLKGPEFAYRRKARLAVRYVQKKEEVLVGFREKNSSFITNMESCEILDARVAVLLPLLRTLIRSLQAYRHIPQIEVAVGDERPDGHSVALIFRHLFPLQQGDQDKLAAFGAGHKLDIYLQGGGPASISKLYPPQSEPRLTYSIPQFGLELGFHPADFTQVNADINRDMISRAIDLLDLNNQDRVLDLFCGLGNFSLPMATRAEYVLGIEGDKAMVERGSENASRNQRNNLDFACADLSDPKQADFWADKGITKVLLDPPRSGALEILPAVAASKAQRIVYVSCNPSTLARDAARLNELGYKLAAAGVMDMFPQTTHVESIALFTVSGAGQEQDDD